MEGFWISKGSEDPIIQESYILTDQVKTQFNNDTFVWFSLPAFQVRQNLADLSRIVSLCDHPVLLQVASYTVLSTSYHMNDDTK